MAIEDQPEALQVGVGCLMILGVLAGLIFGVPWLWNALNEAQEKQDRQDCEAMVGKMLAGEASDTNQDWYYWNC